MIQHFHIPSSMWENNRPSHQSAGGHRSATSRTHSYSTSSLLRAAAGSEWSAMMSSISHNSQRQFYTKFVSFSHCCFQGHVQYDLVPFFWGFGLTTLPRHGCVVVKAWTYDIQCYWMLLTTELKTPATSLYMRRSEGTIQNIQSEDICWCTQVNDSSEFWWWPLLDKVTEHHSLKGQSVFVYGWKWSGWTGEDSRDQQGREDRWLPRE